MQTVVSILTAGARETVAFRSVLQGLIARGVRRDFLAKQSGLKRPAFAMWLYQTEDRPIAISRPALSRLRTYVSELDREVRLIQADLAAMYGGWLGRTEQ